MENARENQRAFPHAAIVGCGNIGSFFDEKAPAPFPITHASAYLGNKGVSLVAGCDSNEARLREFGKARSVQRLYTDYTELFAREKIDILSVCSHLDSRLPVIRAALESGIRHIICEKPLTASLAEAQEILDLQEKYGAKIAVNFIRRWNRGIRKVKEVLDRSSPSEIQAVTIYYEKGFLNNGSHVLDLVNYFWGGEIRLIAKRRIQDDRVAGADPSLSAVFELATGGQAFQVAMNAVDHRCFSIFEFDILHKKGRIRITEAGNRIYFFGVVPDRDCPEYPVLQLEQDLQDAGADAFACLIQNMVDAYHGRAELLCTAKDALATLKMIEAIRS